MSTFIEPWVKLRKNGNHFKPHEVAFIEREYRSKTPAREVAKALKCAARTIYARYEGLRKAGVRQMDDRVEVPPNFYKGNFDLGVSA